jgi:lipid-A-disaccharide synthase
MKYYIIAGEASGDLHAANLMRELKQLDGNAKFRFWGGDRMQAQGGELVKHYRDLAFMGFYEVLANLRTILNNIRYCKDDIDKFNPHALILVDYPGFNLRIAKYAHRQGYKVFHYISPQVWAWKKSRVHKIKKWVNRMFVILPFEKAFYAGYGIDVDFVGHPLLDAIEIEKPQLADSTTFRQQHNLDDRPVIALLPGSRKQEIAKMLPVMMNVQKLFAGYQFLVAGATSIPPDFYARFSPDKSIKIIYNQTLSLLTNAKAALVTSGTATLETALLDVPQVVCYKGNWLSFQIARRIVDVKYISLVNLIMDKPVIPELIQQQMNVESVEQHLRMILEEDNYQRIKKDYRNLREKLGGLGASGNAATLIMAELRKDQN